jgi:two-component system chemotaxis response regulator CheB
MVKIRAVVVDDSAFMRKSISIMLESDGSIEVVGAARDGLEGFEMVKQLKPDIVTMDIEMPKMDGLTSLQKIMAECPTSVLMISSLTTEGAESTLKALELGAVDFIPKELSYVSVNIIKIKEELVRKVKEIVKQRALQLRLKKIQMTAAMQSKATPAPAPITKLTLPKGIVKAVALGISTGGPMSLQKVIPLLKKEMKVPMFIVQHMPPKFTKSLADRLNALSNVEVREAVNNEPVCGGVVYLAPGGFHMTLKKSASGGHVIDISENPNTTLHRPCVDVMMNSVVGVYGKNTLGVIMTGMGRDGCDAMKVLKGQGGMTIAQDEPSCVVYGMPKAVVDSGLADVIAPLDRIADVINAAVL